MANRNRWRLVVELDADARVLRHRKRAVLGFDFLLEHVAQVEHAAIGKELDHDRVRNRRDERRVQVMHPMRVQRNVAACRHRGDLPELGDAAENGGVGLEHVRGIVFQQPAEAPPRRFDFPGRNRHVHLRRESSRGPGRRPASAALRPRTG